MQLKHFNIPIFIPHVACPHKCIFCDQKSISGTLKAPSVNEMRLIIESHLLTIPDNAEIEIAFFGGNFTGIPENLQEQYLQLANEYISNGRVSGIRMSTRPDYISNEILLFLKKSGSNLFILSGINKPLSSAKPLVTAYFRSTKGTDFFVL